MKIPKIPTVFLPKTEFPALPKSTERARLDSKLAALGDFANFYQWQKTRRTTKEDFILLDGPPYANGNAHVGHGINKLLKDFIVKSRIQMGHRVQYRPGWDCHGLPIELKIQKERRGDSDPFWIRQKAREVAECSIQSQMSSFIRWGCSADFHNPYTTMSPEYVSKQLEIFAQFVKNGFVKRALRPVYWSPSSRTALAESELEYKMDHKSLAVYFRFRLINFDISLLQGMTENWINLSKKPIHFYLLIWTTTPWTIPMNNAIGVNPTLEYAAIQFPDETRSTSFRNLYFVAKKLVPEIEKKYKRKVEIVGTIGGEVLAKNKEFYYKNAMYNDLAQPILAATFVREDAGTGLVHLAFAHGHEDYKIGEKQNLELECFVDENGQYTRHMGYALEGKKVLGEGNRAALDLLKKDVIHEHEHSHSYPYDWRTNQPVIIRSCAQWFIDVASTKINAHCFEALEGGENAQIKVTSGTNDLHSSFAAFFTRRDFWCISRQRAWGVPIPAIRHCPSQEVLTNVEFIRAYAQLVRVQKDTDLWWTIHIGELAKLEGFPHKDKKLAELEKQNEIMDVWMDSGLAWQTILADNQKSKSSVPDLVVEGMDQFRGWFQSSLVTSIAAKGTIPFKQILVHGMAVDDEGRKMSKSKGNVVIPAALTDGTLGMEAIGADGLRFWAAWLGSETSGEVPIGPGTVENVQLRMRKIRLILRFILGALKKASELKEATGHKLDENFGHISELIEEGGNYPLTMLDRLILAQCDEFTDQCQTFIADYRFGSLMEYFFQFTQKQASTHITFVKDRLYCDPLNSPSHDAALFTLDLLGRMLISTIAPILPHLAVEFLHHHPTLGKEPAKHFRMAFDEEEGRNEAKLVKKAIEHDKEELEEMRQIVKNARLKMAEKLKEKEETGGRKKRKKMELKHFGAVIGGGPSRQMDILRGIGQTELVELFGTSFVKLCYEGLEELTIELTDAKDGEGGMDWCSRCRRMSNEISRRNAAETNLCRRCEQGESAMRESIAKMAFMARLKEKENVGNEENNTGEETQICQMERPSF